MEDNFDYAKAIETLEKIATRVEDPAVSVEEIDRYLSQTDELVNRCREYLRSRREKVETIDK